MLLMISGASKNQAWGFQVRQETPGALSLASRWTTHEHRCGMDVS